MQLQQHLLKEFRKRMTQDGLLWRIAALDFFSDHLAEQTKITQHRASKEALAIDGAITSLQALVNIALGTHTFDHNYKQFNKALYQEQAEVLAQAERFLAVALAELQQERDSSSGGPKLSAADYSLASLPWSEPSLTLFASSLKAYLYQLLAGDNPHFTH